MTIDQLQCTINVSTDWYIIQDVKNKFRNGWDFVREEYISPDRVGLVFQRIYKVPSDSNMFNVYVELNDEDR